MVLNYFKSFTDCGQKIMNEQPQEFVVVNQAAETVQLTFKKLEITTRT